MFKIKTQETKKRYNNLKRMTIFNIKYFNYCIFFIILILGTYYVMGVHDLSIKGFRLYEHKDRLAVLREEDGNLRSKIMLLESYGAISQRADGLEMVKAIGVEYIEVGEGAVAVK